jgi:hypothetical protein
MTPGGQRQPRIANTAIITAEGVIIPSANSFVGGEARSKTLTIVSLLQDFIRLLLVDERDQLLLDVLPAEVVCGRQRGAAEQ